METFCHILQSEGFNARVYIDDVLLVEKTLGRATAGFRRAKALITELGIDQSISKEQKPTRTLKFIGYYLNTNNMTISIPADRIKEILDLLHLWTQKIRVTRLQLQRLLGKLFYVTRCTQPGRLFLCRLLQTLRNTPEVGTISLTAEFYKDIYWFIYMLTSYNLVHLLDPPMIENHIYLTNNGNHHTAIMWPYFYTINFTTSELIHEAPLYNMLAAVNTWAKKCYEQKLIIHTYHKKFLHLINTGDTKNAAHMSIARQIWLVSALNHCQVRARYLTNIPTFPQPMCLATPPSHALLLNANL